MARKHNPSHPPEASSASTPAAAAAQPHVITLRLSSEEYRKVKGAADAYGGVVARYLRSVLFSSEDADKKRMAAEGDAERRQMVAIQGVRSDFKKMVDFYKKIVDDFNEGITGCVFSADSLQAVRAVESLVNQTLSLQSSLNLVLKIYHEKEEHAATPISVACPAAQVPPTTVEEYKIKYCYMQKITIIGHISVDATTYKAKDGQQKMKFRVCVDSFTGKGKKTVSYAVFADKSDVMQYLVKGKMVIIIGNYDQTLRKDNDGNIVADKNTGEPIIDNFIYADSINLGG